MECLGLMTISGAMNISQWEQSKTDTQCNESLHFTRKSKMVQWTAMLSISQCHQCGMKWRRRSLDTIGNLHVCKKSAQIFAHTLRLATNTSLSQNECDIAEIILRQSLSTHVGFEPVNSHAESQGSEFCQFCLMKMEKSQCMQTAAHDAHASVLAFQVTCLQNCSWIIPNETCTLALSLFRIQA